jgi:hypothetical protein
MNNQIPVTNSAVSPITPPPLDQPKTIKKNIKSIIINTFNKFKSNKRVFLPVSISLGLIFLIIVIGVIFGKRTTTQVVTKNAATPTPIVQSSPQATTSGDVLLTNQNKLNDLKNQINNLDIKEGELQPPTLNFDIKFE